MLLPISQQTDISLLSERQYKKSSSLLPLKTKGLFGWAVAVKKVAVGCELWKKLL
jgi:hypothetical protein